MNSGCNLKTEPTGFANGWKVRYERERGVKDERCLEFWPEHQEECSCHEPINCLLC